MDISTDNENNKRVINTPLMQQNLTIDGVTATVKEWIRANGVSEWTLRRRLQHGSSILDAIVRTSHEKTCEVCGNQYESISNRSISCDECSGIIDSARARLNLKRRQGEYKNVTLEMVIDFARKMYNGEVECRCGKLHKSIKQSNKNKKTCQACGGEFMAGPNDIYCRPCIREGYDALHEVTGKIYSRRLAKQESVNIVGGWRGRPVAGGKAAKKRDTN